MFAVGRSKPLQRGLARRAAAPAQIAAVEMQKIEHVIDETIGSAVLQIGLQQRKSGDAASILDYQFAVEQRSFGRQRRDRFGDRLEAVRPVQAACGSADALCHGRAAPRCDSRRI